MRVDFKRGVLVFGLLIGSMTITACAPKKRNNEFIKKDLGVLIQVSDPSELQALPADVKAEPIIQGSDIYRVVDMDIEDIKALLPNATVAEDAFVQTDPTSPSNDLDLNDDFFKVRNCDPKAEKPLPVIDLASSTDKFMLDSVKLGSGAIRFTATKSLNSDELKVALKKNPTFRNYMLTDKNGISLLKNQGNIVTDALDAIASIFNGNKKKSATSTEPTKPTAPRLAFEWRVISPLKSKVPVKYISQTEIEFTPDRTGSYDIMLRVDDRVSHGCLISQPLTVGATENVNFKGAASVDRPFNATDRLDFAHIPALQAEQAWKKTRGQGVTIAVLDSGANYNHPELSSNIKINEKEIPNNNLDDDNNGLVDDVYGWDFLFKDNQPWDDNSHGTHVTGLAAARNFGVANRAKILVVKVGTPTGRTPFGQLIAGIKYAVDQGADVINLSLGITGGAPELRAMAKTAFDYAESKGVVIVTAAGNDSTPLRPISNDVVDSIPANLENENNIAVAATDLYGQLTSYSQFGIKNVDVAAPGGTDTDPLRSIFNATDVAPFIRYAGTSMATPIVAGTVALVLSINPSLTPADVRNILLATSTPTAALKDRVTSGGMINANQAVESAGIKPLAFN